MALDWAASRRARVSEEGKKSFEKRPFPLRSWAELLKAPISKTIWPYFPTEVEIIKSTLPANNRSDAIETIVRAAQFYVRAQTRRSRTTSNPHREIERLRAGIEELFDALNGLSPQARNYLRSKMRPAHLPGDAPFTAESLRNAIDKFDHENRLALDVLPAKIRGGPKERTHEKRLYNALKQAFLGAHGGKAIRGWPKFLTACTLPLNEFGLPVRSDKAWQDVTRQRRNNPGKNR
jgi:hypothetical protein